MPEKKYLYENGHPCIYKSRDGLYALLTEEGFMVNTKIDVIIPTFHPNEDFALLLERLEKQKMPVHKVLVMNTEESFWNPEWEKRFSFLEIHHLKKSEFDHGGTRRAAASLSTADIMVFMTQDAMPANRDLIGNLVRPLQENAEIGASYARQLPNPSCNFLERYTRKFNYPDQPLVKTAKDLPVYGIKTYFCSNVCAAYSKKVYEELGGFVERAIFNEDMIYAGAVIKSGRGIAYAADAMVIHSHNYSAMQQFHRNFDLGVSQAEHPEVFKDVPSEGEGMRLVKKTLLYLLRRGRIWLIPVLVLQSACKYLGYMLGKNYSRLPKKWILRFTMNQDYWK